MKCDDCLNARRVLSENGWHPVCVLANKQAKLCIFGNKNYYVSAKGEKKESERK